MPYGVSDSQVYNIEAARKFVDNEFAKGKASQFWNAIEGKWKLSALAKATTMPGSTLTHWINKWKLQGPTTKSTATAVLPTTRKATKRELVDATIAQITGEKQAKSKSEPTTTVLKPMAISEFMDYVSKLESRNKQLEAELVNWQKLAGNILESKI